MKKITLTVILTLLATTHVMHPAAHPRPQAALPITIAGNATDPVKFTCGSISETVSSLRVFNAPNPALLHQTFSLEFLGGIDQGLRLFYPAVPGILITVSALSARNTQLALPR